MNNFHLNQYDYENKIDLTPNDIKIITNLNDNLALYFLFIIVSGHTNENDFFNGCNNGFEIYYDIEKCNVFKKYNINDDKQYQLLKMPCSIFYSKHNNQILHNYTICYTINKEMINLKMEIDEKNMKIIKFQKRKHAFKDTIQAIKLRMYIVFNKIIKLMISKRIERFTINQINIPDIINNFLA